uniref:Olfactory receptor n=1 Tax=Pyxicephalus adspersus TaxID=30357 RepID=A0AAV3B4A5_PYXAD|nr:TPA: hypothetical protein GDO54_005755 [Pyxicephalus adspersus]
MHNPNNITTLLFVGFHDLHRFKLLLFTILFMTYCLTICGNLVIITLVYYNKSLHTPMYFFLSQLSVTDIILTTDISPNMLNIVLHEQTFISVSGCISQLHIFASAEMLECFILTLMSYDRYLAICSPLQYALIMNHVLCIKLTFVSWLLSCSIPFIITFSILQLHFCGPNTIDHFFCDFYPLVKLSWSDPSIVILEATVVSMHVIVVPFVLIVASYMFIVVTILKITSFSGRLKSFSTCSSHLAVVSIFYGTLIATYMLPKEKSQVVSKALSLLYTVFTPLFNPFIYSLRNKDIKKAWRNVLPKFL